MNKLLTTICIVGIVGIAGVLCVCSGCSKPEVGDTATLETASAETTAVAPETASAEETQSIIETLCDCEVCERVYIGSQGEIRVKFHGNGYKRDIAFEIHAEEGECFVNNEEFILAEKTVKLIIDLDRDYEETIEKIRFDPEAEMDSRYPSGKNYADQRFNSGSDLTGIGWVGKYEEFENSFIVQAGFSDSADFATGIIIVFKEEYGEWIVVNIIGIYAES